MSAPAPRRATHDAVHPGIRPAVASSIARDIVGVTRMADLVRFPRLADLVAPSPVFAQSSADLAIRAVTDQMRSLHGAPTIATASLGIASAVGATSAYAPALAALREATRPPRVTVSPAWVHSPQLSAAVDSLRAASRMADIKPRVPAAAWVPQLSAAVDSRLRAASRMADITAPRVPTAALRPLLFEGHQAAMRQLAGVITGVATQDPAWLTAARDVLDRPELRELVRDPAVQREASQLAESVWPPSTEGLAANAAIATAVLFAVVVSVLLAYGYGDELAKFGTAAAITMLPLTALGAWQVIEKTRPKTLDDDQQR